VVEQEMRKVRTSYVLRELYKYSDTIADNKRKTGMDMALKRMDYGN
jgi:hypothetical protein